MLMEITALHVFLPELQLLTAAELTSGGNRERNTEYRPHSYRAAAEMLQVLSYMWQSRQLQAVNQGHLNGRMFFFLYFFIFLVYDSG